MRPALAALAILFSLTFAATAGETVTRHAMSPRAAQAFFDEMNAKGWRYRKVDTVSTPGGVRYAMTFSDEKQPRFLARSGLSASRYRTALDEALKDGFRPVAVTVSDMGDGQFAAIFEKNDGRAWLARHGMTLEAFQAALAEQTKSGRRLADVDCYVSGDQVSYAALFEAASGPAWEVWVNMSSSAWLEKLNDAIANGLRPTKINVCSMSDGPRFAGIFEKANDRIWRARHNMSEAAYQAEFDANSAKGLTLTDLSAYQSGNETLYAAIWTK
jgi:hypothetical protein